MPALTKTGLATELPYSIICTARSISAFQLIMICRTVCESPTLTADITLLLLRCSI